MNNNQNRTSKIEDVKMGKILNRQSVKNKFISFWQQKNFQKEERFSVIPPENWTSTLFVNSGLIRYIELVEKNGILNPALTSCQPCVKIGSGKFSLDEMLSRDGYFTFFEQLTCGADADAIPMEWFVKNVWNYLTSVAYLPPDKIYAGFHSSQKVMMNNWIKAGLPKQNIIFPDNNVFVLNLPEKNIHGIYSPLYFDRGIDHPFSCQKNNCHINCDCGRFLELGDTGLISIGNKKIIDHGIGLERMISIQTGLIRVTDIPEFTILISILEKELKPTHPHLIILADHLRSTVILLSSNLKPGNKKREYVLRNLIRRTLWLAFGNTAFDKEKIARIYGQISAEMNKFYPYLIINKQIAAEIDEIEKETKKYSDILILGKKAIKKYLGKTNHRTPSAEDLIFFYKTHGIPKELTKTFWKEFQQ